MGANWSYIRVNGKGNGNYYGIMGRHHDVRFRSGAVCEAYPTLVGLLCSCPSHRDLHGRHGVWREQDNKNPSKKCHTKRGGLRVAPGPVQCCNPLQI